MSMLPSEGSRKKGRECGKFRPDTPSTRVWHRSNAPRQAMYCTPPFVTNDFELNGRDLMQTIKANNETGSAAYNMQPWAGIRHNMCSKSDATYDQGRTRSGRMPDERHLRSTRATTPHKPTQDVVQQHRHRLCGLRQCQPPPPSLPSCPSEPTSTPLSCNLL